MGKGLDTGYAMRNKKVKLILPAVVLAAGAFWGAWQYGSDDAGLPPLYTVEVERGDVSRRVVAHGSLQPVEQVEVGSQVSGIVEEIHVDFNSPVRRGQVIAQIDPSTFATAVSSAEAELDATETGERGSMASPPTTSRSDGGRSRPARCI